MKEPTLPSPDAAHEEVRRYKKALSRYRCAVRDKANSRPLRQLELTRLHLEQEAYNCRAGVLVSGPAIANQLMLWANNLARIEQELRDDGWSDNPIP